MYSVNCWSRWLFLVFVLAIGCNSKPSTTVTNSSEDGEVAAPGAKSAKVPVKRDVKDMIGNWIVVMTNQRPDTKQRIDDYLWLMKFSRGADDKIVGEFIATRDKDEHDKPEVVETEVEGDAIRLVMKNAHATFEFAGSFQQGFIRGTIKAGPGDMYLTRLLPTDEKSLDKFPATGLPPGADVFEAKMKNKDFNPEEFLSTIREYRTSPLAQDMFAMIISAHASAKFNEAKVQEIIDEFLSSARIWGQRWEARAEMTIAVALVNGRQFPRLALAHFDAAEKLMGDDRVALQDTLTAYREAANANIRILDIMTPDSTDEVKAEACLELTELLKKHPYNAEVLLALATQAEKTGKVDLAIQYLSDIVALPLLEATIIQLRAGQPPDTPAPNESLKKLWVQKHGNEDGYHQHLTEVYHQKLGGLLAEIQQQAPAVPAAESGNRVVLVELFTGLQCVPCIAADLAVGAIGKTFPQSEVITIQYHQHSPLPDGLVNQDSEERAAFYELPNVPAIVIDGLQILNQYYSGPIQATPGAYGVLRRLIDLRLSEKTDIAIKLSAVVADRQLTVDVEATGVPEDLLPSCRLRMAIVENDVHTYLPLASNGIRDHEFVVRELLGGSKGIPPKKGELKYSMTMPVVDLQQHVVDYIARFEAGRRLEFLPEMKPPIRGPLSLVAWVQNGAPDKTTNFKLVLQAAIIPITGDTGFETTTNPAVTAPDKKDVPSTTPPAPALPE